MRSTTENPLKALLIRYIESEGSISVAEYMRLALSHPHYGYYSNNDPLGVNGDFITSPEISQVFGEMLGIWCALAWQQMGKPAKCILVEMGPGRGTLMKDMMRATKHVEGFHQAISIHMIEINHHLKTLQQQALEIVDVPCQWHDDMTSLPPLPMINIANEFYDALPIYQYVKTVKAWQERRIIYDYNQDEFQFSLSSHVLNDRVIGHPHAMPGAIFEQCPQALHILATIAEQLNQYGGVSLLIDYGYDSYDYGNSLQAVSAHQKVSMFHDPGKVDLTAHVDFTALKNQAMYLGLKVGGPVSQRAFLTSLGINERTVSLCRGASKEQQLMIQAATERLISRQEMGDLFKVMVCYAPNLSLPYGFL